MKKIWKITAALILAYLLLYFHNACVITAELILSRQSENLFVAAMVLIIGCAFKSALVFVPKQIPARDPVVVNRVSCRYHGEWNASYL